MKDLELLNLCSQSYSGNVEYQGATFRSYQAGFNTFVFMTIYNGTGIIVFQGTLGGINYLKWGWIAKLLNKLGMNSPSWISDFDVGKRAIPYRWNKRKIIKAHDGFLNSYTEIRAKAVDIYKNAQEIYITGHSRGGALSTLCAFDLAHKGNKKIHVTTFGAPRSLGLFGMMAFKRLKSINYKRYEEKSDLVPKLPPFWLNYFHVGKKEAIGKDMNIEKAHYVATYEADLPK